VHSVRAAGGGIVTIRLAREPGMAVVSVEDDGPPFDERAKDTLFDPLRSTKTHGLGLGLPIARALARAMRGDLALADAGRKAFRLELPLPPAGTVGTAETAEAS
jgi:signal transduction histidine kinase